MRQPLPMWVFTFRITHDGKAYWYSAFEESETAAELKIKMKYGVPEHAVFQMASKIEDRRKKERRAE